MIALQGIKSRFAACLVLDVCLRDVNGAIRMLNRKTVIVINSIKDGIGETLVWALERGQSSVKLDGSVMECLDLGNKLCAIKLSPRDQPAKVERIIHIRLPCIVAAYQTSADRRPRLGPQKGYSRVVSSLLLGQLRDAT